MSCPVLQRGQVCLRSTPPCAPSCSYSRAPHKGRTSFGSPFNSLRGACWSEPGFDRRYSLHRYTAAQASPRGDSEARSQGGESRGGLDPRLEQAVPPEQRPVNELAQLRRSNFYSWAVLDAPSYALRLGLLWLGFFVVLGGPIAYQTFDPTEQPLQYFLSGMTGALLVVVTAVLYIYSGWSYVGDRLLSASVEYEETGWYDGQLFVKPPEVLARDRLLGSYEVRPVLQRLKATLVACGATLLISGGLLVGAIVSNSDADGVYGRGAARQPVKVTAEGLIYSNKVRDVGQLKDLDDLAAAEAEAQGGIPGYCRDRYYKAVSGGQYCAAFGDKGLPR